MFFFFFLSSIWTLLTVIYQQGMSPSSCLLFIRVHGGVTRREASGRSSAAWRVLPSPFLQVFCRAVLNPCNFLPHTDITGEKQSPGEHPWSQYAHVSSYLSNCRLQTQEVITALLTLFVFSCSSFLMKKALNLLLWTLPSPELSPVWQMVRYDRFMPMRDNNF